MQIFNANEMEEEYKYEQTWQRNIKIFIIVEICVKI